MDEAYFNWLCTMLGNGTDPEYSYWELCRLLHNKQFYALMPMDENRALDGQGLRSRYNRQFGGSLDLSSPCTVLEMIAALAGRMDYELADETNEDRTPWCFAQMLLSMGLLTCTDASYIGAEWFPDQVNTVVERLMNRTYQADGTGGLFVIHGVPYDVRRLDIWYQMQTWLVQNCGDSQDFQEECEL